jgi:hypothetical protein
VVDSANEVSASSVHQRIALLHPVSPKTFLLPTKGFWIGFFAHRSPLTALRTLERDFNRNLLFGSGLAAIVFVGSDQIQVRRAHELALEGLLSAELWQIDADGRVIDVQTLRSASAPKCIPLDLPVIEVGDPATCWLLKELWSNLNSFLEQAVRLMPLAVPEIRELADEVNIFMGEIHEMDRLVAASAKSTSATKQADLLEAKRRRDTAVDWLVQVNSALVYTLTQTFYGTTPSNSDRPLISNHSLLGTGTGWRAILRVYLQVKSAFRKRSVPLAIRNKFGTLGAIDASDHQATQAIREIALPDAAATPYQPDLGMSPKVLHFSGRLGFGETDVSVTCPVQAIMTCDGAQWSLATMTHEMLHTHVRDLLAALFSRRDAAGSEQPFDLSLRQALRAFPAGGVEDPKVFQSLLEYVRAVIIDYAFEYRNCLEQLNTWTNLGTPGQGGNSQRAVGVTIPDEDKQVNAFRKAQRFIEEVMVHVLDVHYFYHGDAELFVKSLWNTWATVPAVLNRIDFYILRTLLGIASTTRGAELGRLETSVKIFLSAIQDMGEHGRAWEVISEVQRRFEKDNRFSTWLEMLFRSSLRLGDLTANILRNSALEAEILGLRDELVESTDEGFTYGLEVGSFAERQVDSPLALLFHRLREAVTHSPEKDGLALARRSSWLLIAASSGGN